MEARSPQRGRAVNSIYAYSYKGTKEAWLAVGCNVAAAAIEGSVRLVGGFGTLCDPLHTGIVEVFHDDEWGALCLDTTPPDTLVADVVCRQLGFPHGSPSDPRVARVGPAAADDDDRYDAGYQERPEESEIPQERFWLTEVNCRGPEAALADCDLGPGFVQGLSSCSEGSGGPVRRFHAACRQFAVDEALEAVTTPGAGAPPFFPSMTALVQCTT